MVPLHLSAGMTTSWRTARGALISLVGLALCANGVPEGLGPLLAGAALAPPSSQALRWLTCAGASTPAHSWILAYTKRVD